MHVFSVVLHTKYQEQRKCTKKEPNMNKEDQEYRYIKPCSFQDCTGLIPSGPADEAEIGHYEELYPFLPKVPQEKNRAKNRL